MERILDIAVGFAHSIPVCLVLLYLGPEPVYPQTTTGTILGAVSDSSGSVVRGATTNVTFSINGMRPESNSVTLDGVEMSSIRESDVDMRPNLDAVSEFKVLTSAFSAEYGHTAGGVISIQTKGGSNEFHGSLFELLRTDSLNSANFFRNPF